MLRVARATRPFPWTALDRVPREAVTRLSDARRAVRRYLDTDGLARALGELLATEVRVASFEVSVATAVEPAPRGPAVSFATTDGAARISVELDRDLARLLVGTVLGRGTALADPRAPDAPAVQGALAAILAHAARRAHGDRGALVALGPGGLRVATGDRVLVVEAHLLVDVEAFSVRALVHVALGAPRPRRSAREGLVSLGRAPIALAAIAAASTATRAEVAALGPGDVWLPGGGWTVRREGEELVGELRLAAAAGARAIAARLEPGGRLVVLASAHAPLEVESMSTEPDEVSSLAEAVIDAPVVVRVEVGAVTLAAREWAELAPGDVVTLGRRLGEPVTLRVAGHEVARGELVDVDGELGVRVLARDGGR